MSTVTTQQNLDTCGEIITNKLKFPFKNSFVEITALPKEEIKTGLCPVCGEVKDLAFQKDNKGYITFICRGCAIAYVKSCNKIDDLQRLEIKESENRKIEKKYVPKPFLVRVKEGNQKSNHWVDTTTGITYEPLNIPYNEAQHGLCARLGRSILKAVVATDDLKHKVFEPIVLVAKEPLKPVSTLKSITVKFHDVDKRLSIWIFEPYDIQEVFKGLDEGLNERELAVKVCSNREAIGKLIEVIERRGLDLTTLGGDKKENGWDATKRRNGDIRRFSYDLRY